MPRFVPALVIALLLPAAALAGTPVELGHVQWVDPSDGFATEGALIHANDDAIADVIVGAGDRFAPYIWCAGRGNPGPLIDARKDEALQPPPRVYALDGATGEPLWERVWDTGGLVGVRPERETSEQLDGVHTGDLDGDGDDDLLVLRSTVDVQSLRVTQHTSMLDPADGSVLWQQTEVVEGTPDVPRVLFPMEILGEPGGLIVSAEIHRGEPPLTRTTVVRFLPNAPPETLLEIPAAEPGIVYPYVIPLADRLRIVRIVAHITPLPNPSVTIDLEALDLMRDEERELVLDPLWYLPAVNGFPVMVTGGADPLIVVGVQDRALALDPDDGTQRWAGPDDTSPIGGMMRAADVNRDGIDDVLLTTQFGPKPVEDPVLAGGVTAQIVAIDGRNGSELWRREELAGKFHATDMALADIDADAKPELVAAYTHQDGFATCSYPADEAGLLGVYDLATGAQRCRFSMDRLSSSILAADVNEAEGHEVISTTLGGRTYAFTHADPGCGVLGTSP